MTNGEKIAVRITGVDAELPSDVITSAEVRSAPGLGGRSSVEPGWQSDESPAWGD